MISCIKKTDKSVWCLNTDIPRRQQLQAISIFPLASNFLLQTYFKVYQSSRLLNLRKKSLNKEGYKIRLILGINDPQQTSR